jgi:hydroxyacylglutathione hydrolase
MILRQFLHTDPVAASYVFGCGGKAMGAVVDPLGDVALYLRTAEETRMRIRYVIDTHLHADHVSTGRELAKASGAEYVLFADANVNFPFHTPSRRPVVRWRRCSAVTMTKSRSRAVVARQTILRGRC